MCTRRIHTIGPAIGLLLPLLISPVCSQSTNTVFQTLQTTYNQALKEQKADQLVMRHKMSTHYLAFLDSLANEFRQRGDLDTLLVLRKEKTRFEADPTIPDSLNLKLPEPTRRRLEEMARAHARAIRQWDADYLKLTHLYLGRLDRQVRQLTAADRIPEAVTIQSEAKNIRASDRYRGAVEAAKAEKVAGGPNQPVARGRVLLADNFNRRELGKLWSVSGSTVTLENGVVGTPDNSQWLQPDKNFRGNFRVEVDVKRDGEQDHSSWDFAIRLLNPHWEFSTHFHRDKLNHLQLNGLTVSPSEGKTYEQPGRMILEHMKGKIRCSFVDHKRNVFQSDWVDAPSIEETQIRIMLAGKGEDGKRYADNVRVLRLP